MWSIREMFLNELGLGAKFVTDAATSHLIATFCQDIGAKFVKDGVTAYLIETLCGHIYWFSLVHIGRGSSFERV